jgi:hypothetical protein
MDDRPGRVDDLAADDVRVTGAHVVVGRRDGEGRCRADGGESRHEGQCVETVDCLHLFVSLGSWAAPCGFVGGRLLGPGFTPATRR